MIENRHVIVRSEKLEKNTREAIQIAEITKMQIEINNRIQLTTDLKEWKKNSAFSICRNYMFLPNSTWYLCVGTFKGMKYS